MKKIVLTLSFVALFNIATKAQDPVKKSTEEKATNAPVKEETKKSGTRMAINEKGTAGTGKPSTSKKETTKEEKTGSALSPTGPVSKPQ